ncbi:MAG: acyl-CoA thioesterase [Elainella sp.]
MSAPCFEYPIRVQPHHTDYAGIVWHGTYLTWLEEARVEALRSTGIDYADLVALGCELPVVELSLRYRASLKMGMAAVVKARMRPLTGVRVHWDYEIWADQQLCVTAQVTLVPLDRQGKILRQLPIALEQALGKLAGR